MDGSSFCFCTPTYTAADAGNNAAAAAAAAAAIGSGSGPGPGSTYYSVPVWHRLVLAACSYVPESITLSQAQTPYQSQRSVDTLCC